MQLINFVVVGKVSYLMKLHCREACEYSFRQYLMTRFFSLLLFSLRMDCISKLNIFSFRVICEAWGELGLKFLHGSLFKCKWKALEGFFYF